MRSLGGGSISRRARGRTRDKANNNGATPLLIATQKARSSVVRYLLRQGADLNKANNDGQLPIAVAADEEIKKLIREEIKHRKRCKSK